ncbi:hypothetical protein ND16A_3362 [Thalassotalea sp. ND16A]|nr:hypothetical protein ND16A_3362 [Thalassotalea sp. ND16A]
MCPLSEQQLEQLMAKPLPKLDAEEFVQQTLNKANQRNLQRFWILQICALVALATLLWFLPSAAIIQAVSQFNVIEMSSMQTALMTSVPLLMLALVCYFIKDELL